MQVIQIRVGKNMDGYTFSILPTERQYIKSMVPGSHPANRVSVGYDVNNDFDFFKGKLENYVYPVLFGIDNSTDLAKLEEIEFIDTFTGNLIHRVQH